MSESENIRSQSVTFQCWQNLATGEYQWMTVLGDPPRLHRHGPPHKTEREARDWFDKHGGFRTLDEERWAMVAPEVKAMLEADWRRPQRISLVKWARNKIAALRKKYDRAISK